MIIIYIICINCCTNTELFNEKNLF